MLHDAECSKDRRSIDQRCLRRRLGITWRDFINDADEDPDTDDSSSLEWHDEAQTFIDVGSCLSDVIYH